jgi:hypothetical protein
MNVLGGIIYNRYTQDNAQIALGLRQVLFGASWELGIVVLLTVKWHTHIILVTVPQGSKPAHLIELQ